MWEPVHRVQNGDGREQACLPCLGCSLRPDLEKASFQFPSHVESCLFFYLLSLCWDNAEQNEAYNLCFRLWAQFLKANNIGSRRCPLAEHTFSYLLCS